MLAGVRRIATRRLATVPQLSAEVADALGSNRPVVSLESTIITHGLPYPQNIDMATTVERIVRDHGAVPATCAFINGVPKVGLSSQDLEQLAEQAQQGKVTKVSRRDIGAVMANKAFGGTTIALTMILSDRAGISVFATGGLGGVHRGASETFDISADLTELGRTPVLVVCLGPKLILDIGLTMEYLETQGVMVSTYNDDGAQTDVPGFYCRQLGIKLPYLFDSFAHAADIIRNQRLLNLGSGNVFCIPPPKDIALDPQFIDAIIDNANHQARIKGIKGKDTTPFLLAEIARATDGRSVLCNIEFVYNNARAAANIATALHPSATLTHQPQFNTTNHAYSSAKPHEPPAESEPEWVPKPFGLTPKATVMVVGSLALDTITTMAKPILGDSNPGRVSSLVGGVGHNIAVNAHNSLALPFVSGALSAVGSAGLVSIVGTDDAGNRILDHLRRDDTIDISSIYKSSDVATAQYVAHHDAEGELIIACADMLAIESDFTPHISASLKAAAPQVVVADCNLSPQVLPAVIRQAKSLHSLTIIDPTLGVKAARVGAINTGVFPHHQVDLITPTTTELLTIYTAFDSHGKFDDYDHWFPVLDKLGANHIFRDRLERAHPVLAQLLNDGILQQLFHLLPYLPFQLVKLGPSGVVAVLLSTATEDYRSLPTTSPYCPEAIVTSNDSGAGIVVKYWPVPQENRDVVVENVTGAGDAFVGFLLATLAHSNWLTLEITSVESEWHQWECIYKAQLASGLTLQCPSSTTAKLAAIH